MFSMEAAATSNVVEPIVVTDAVKSRADTETGVGDEEESGKVLITQIEVSVIDGNVSLCIEISYPKTMKYDFFFWFNRPVFVLFDISMEFC